jgi:hypothetical protein
MQEHRDALKQARAASKSNPKRPTVRVPTDYVDDALLSARQAAAFIGCSSREFARLCDSGSVHGESTSVGILYRAGSLREIKHQRARRAAA